MGNEPTVKTRSFIKRLQSLPLRVLVAILIIESIVFLGLIFILVLVVFNN